METEFWFFRGCCSSFITYMRSSKSQQEAIKHISHNVVHLKQWNRKLYFCLTDHEPLKCVDVPLTVPQPLSAGCGFGPLMQIWFIINNKLNVVWNTPPTWQRYNQTISIHSQEKRTTTNQAHVDCAATTGSLRPDTRPWSWSVIPNNTRPRATSKRLHLNYFDKIEIMIWFLKL